MRLLAGALALTLSAPVSAADSASVLVVVNQNSSLSRRIGDYYVHRRSIPLRNVCRIDAPAQETVSWETWEHHVQAGVETCLRRGGLAESILYIVTTAGVPLRISGPGQGPASEAAAADSELALLYSRLKGAAHPRRGAVPNPFYRETGKPFSHPRFPIYLVTRLAAYDFAGVQAIIDRAARARNRGKFVIDLNSAESSTGNNWLREAARALPPGRVILDETDLVLDKQHDVIGYAAWGSNDRHRKQRFLGFRWLPGAIVTEFVSTNGRTFERPPETWTISTWKPTDRLLWFAGSPQTLTADYLQEGATGSSGHVYEPYLTNCPRPEILLPAYLSGRTLAESYYLALPSLSWQNIVVGDPLCRLR
jgi:uncharacterized protein (TIGR03790 family)